MEFRQIEAATVDNRGVIRDILYDVNFRHAAVIDSYKKGIIRGNHYHKMSTQAIFVTRGSLVYWWKDLTEKGPPHAITVEEYEMVTTPPFEIHALEMLSLNQFIVFSDGIRGGPDYESDTFRVTPILTPDMLGSHG